MSTAARPLPIGSLARLSLPTPEGRHVELEAYRGRALVVSFLSHGG